MATRLAASLPSPLKTKNASPTPTPFASFPLHRSIQFRHPKHHRQILSPLPHHWAPNGARGGFTFFAVFGRESVITEEINNRETASDDGGESEPKKRQTRPCELYVCNLPRSHDIAALVEMFKPFGTVISAEISRNPETGVSKGSGYITMGSVSSARTAISQLDGSDVGGREMRVRFSADVVSAGRKPDALISGPTRFQFYESPHKVYVGNLPWSATPAGLKEHFGRFGTVESARILYDRKGGRNRAYGFVSFSAEAECDAALSLNGTDLDGRSLVVKGVASKDDQD